MAESIFNNKITLSSKNEVLNMKVDIIKHETFIEVRLIEFNNIFNLYVCTISQPDYYIYKREQEITVDYERFISELVKLFHSLSLNRYNGLFIDNTLKFIEYGDFRNICKLELKFNKPDEHQYKMYISDIIRRLESDNVKLYKETKLLREKCIDGDRSLNDKIRHLELENNEYRKRIETLSNEISNIEYKYSSEKQEFSNMTNRHYELETENKRLKEELEEFNKDNPVSLKSRLSNKDLEINRYKGEIKSNSNLIDQLRTENRELKAYKRNKEGFDEDSEAAKTLKEKYEELFNKNKQIEEKYKDIKTTLKEKKSKIESLQSKNKELSKQLANAQNVYNHFYNKNVGDTDYKGDDVDFPEFNLQSENPPSI
ncbi:SAS6 [Hepatospora eriocheir]|uniref:SAS6 n=1 Tax=Hepatospora eriocheir TaxID=1081669 RepID=A0A1X0QI13_9MICR|nr:SAS6 [Hepatospora eriocheir]